MVVGAKVCELTDCFLWFVCGNIDVIPLIQADILVHEGGHIRGGPLSF